MAGKEISDSEIDKEKKSDSLPNTSDLSWNPGDPVSNLAILKYELDNIRRTAPLLNELVLTGQEIIALPIRAVQAIAVSHPLITNHLLNALANQGENGNQPAKKPASSSSGNSSESVAAATVAETPAVGSSRITSDTTITTGARNKDASNSKQNNDNLNQTMEIAPDVQVYDEIFGDDDAPDYAKQDKLATAKIDQLATVGDSNALGNYLKDLTDERILDYGLSALLECDPTNKQLAELAKVDSSCGRAALAMLLDLGDEQCGAIVKARIKDGSLAQNIIDRDFDAVTLLKLPGVDAKQLFCDIVASIKGDSVSANTSKLCSCILNASLDGSILPIDLPSGYGPPVGQQAALRTMQKLAVETLGKQGDSGRIELLRMARRGNLLAAEGLEAAWKDDPNYKLEHGTRKHVPEEAILRFHESAKRIANQYGLTEQEYNSYSQTGETMRSLAHDMRDHLRGKGGDVFTDTVLGRICDHPKSMRKALADRPELLARFEKIMQEYPEYVKTKEKVEKVTSLLRPEVVSLAKAAGLPAPEFEISHRKGSGGYSIGGAISAKDQYLTKEGLRSADFVNTIVHELGHMEQDVTMLRYLMEECGFKKGEEISTAKFEQLNRKYKRLHGDKELSQEFFKQVVDQWDGKPLTAAEHLRAERLIVTVAQQEQCKKLVAGMNRRSSGFDWYAKLADQASSPERLTEVFNKKGVEHIRKDITRLATEVEAKPILDSLDKLHKLLTSGEDFNSQEFQAAHKELVQRCHDASESLHDRAYQIYRNQFDETDTHAEGERAAKIVEKPQGIQGTNEVLDKCVQLVRDYKMKPDQVTTFLKLLDANQSDNPHFQALKMGSAGALERAARLCAGDRPILDNNNVKNFLKFLGIPAGSTAAQELSHLDALAVERLADAYVRSLPGGKELMNSPRYQLFDERSGLYAQRLMSKALIDQLKPGNRLYDQGWRVMPAGDQSTADRAGADLVLVNIQTGKWLPLDVSERSKQKEFYEKFSRRDYFHVKGRHNGYLLDPSGESVTRFLEGYINKHQKKAFDLKDVPPPDLGACQDATARRRSLDEYGEALVSARKSLENERTTTTKLSELEIIAEKLRCLEQLEKGRDNARKHLIEEQKLQDHASDALARFLKQNADHFSKNNGPSPNQPTDVAPAIKAKIEEMVRISSQDNCVVCHSEIEEGKKFHIGTIRKLVDQAIERADLHDTVKDRIRRNLSKYKFGEGGTPLTADEKLLLDQLKIVVYEGLSTNHGDGKVWSELNTVAGKLKGERERERMKTEGGDKPVTPESSKLSIEKANEEIYKKRFKMGNGGIELTNEGADTSLADLMRAYQEAKATGNGNEAKVAKALEHVQQALKKSPELAGALAESLKPEYSITDGAGELQRILGEGKLGPVVEAAIKNTSVTIDESGTVEPGHPQVILQDKSGKEIKPEEIKRYDNIEREYVMSDGQRIPIADIKPKIVVAASTDAVTLGRELLIGQTQAIQDITRIHRANSKSPKMTIDELAHVDEITRQDFRKETRLINDEMMRADARLLRQTLEKAWNEVQKEFGENKPFPDTYTGHNETERSEMELALERALNNLKKANINAQQLSRLEDIARRAAREVLLPGNTERSAFDVVHKSGQAGKTADGLLFRPSTTLSKDELERYRKELEKYGKNPLIEKQTMEQFMQLLLDKTRTWQQDLKQEHERQKTLSPAVRSARMTMQALAIAEAHQKLGADANQAEIEDYAHKLLSGDTAADKSGAFERSKQYYESLRSEHATCSAHINEVTHARRAALQQAANEFCKKHGLAQIKINVVENLNGAGGSYKPGSGEINIPRSALLDRAGGIKVTNSLFHEIIHLQQDQLIIRNLADKAGIKFTKANDAQFEALKKEYEKSTGSKNLSRDFLDQVLYQRRHGRSEPEKLTPQQAQKAERLAEAFKKAQPVAQIDQYLGNASRVISGVRAVLNAPESSKPSLDLIKRIVDPANKQLCEQLFGSADRQRWPESVRKLVKQYEKATKDAEGVPDNWDEHAARNILANELDRRQAAIEQQHAKNHADYIASFAEQEAHVLGVAMDKMTRAEYIHALYGSSANNDRLHANSPQAEEARDKAKEAGIHLADKANMKDFVDTMAKQLVNWHDDLSVQWEAGSVKRAAIQESYDRALSLARTEAARSGKTGAALEREARRLVENPSSALAKNGAFSEARNQYLQRRSEYFTEFGAVYEAINQRQQQLQSALDKYCAERGLSKVKLELRDSDCPSGGYERGSSTVVVSASDLLSRTRAPEMLANLAKQTVHAQQDSQYISSLIDRVNGSIDQSPKPGEKLTAEQIARIKEEYQSRTGSNLDDKFLEVVRDGRKSIMTKEQIAHADQIAADFQATQKAAADYENRWQDRRAVKVELNKLGEVGDPRCATNLMERLTSPGSEALCRKLFGVSGIDELPAEHPVRKLMSRYKHASVGGLRPAAESDKWSESQAVLELSAALQACDRALQKQQAKLAADYAQHMHAAEGNAIGADVYGETQARLPELTRLRPGDGQGKDLGEAQQRMNVRQNEQRYLDLVTAKLKERNRGKRLSDFTHEEITAAMRAVNTELKGTSGADMFGVKMTAEHARAVAEAGSKLYAEYSKAGNPGADSQPPAVRAAIERVQARMSPPESLLTGSERNYELPFDPCPGARELAALGDGRAVLDTTESSVRLKREGIGGEEWSGDRVPTEEEVKRYVNERIKQMQDEIKRKEAAGETVRPEEKALLEAMVETQKQLASDPKAYETMQPGLKQAFFNRGRAIAGTSIGIGIIVSAAIGWYIKFHNHDKKPAGLGSLDLPGA